MEAAAPDAPDATTAVEEIDRKKLAGSRQPGYPFMPPDVTPSSHPLHSCHFRRCREDSLTLLGKKQWKRESGVCALLQRRRSEVASRYSSSTTATTTSVGGSLVLRIVVRFKRTKRTDVTGCGREVSNKPN